MRVYLGTAGDTRTWQSSDFVGGALPSELDGVSVAVNGMGAPNSLNGVVKVVVTNYGSASAADTVQAQGMAASFFVINGGPYLVEQQFRGKQTRGAGQSLPGVKHSSRTGRNGGAVRQRFRPHLTGGLRDLPATTEFLAADSAARARPSSIRITLVNRR